MLTDRVCVEALSKPPQRLILSRKGFDSAAGGVASPIFPCDSFVSLPIPLPEAPLTYADVRWNGQSLGDIVDDLAHHGCRCKSTDRCHLDPDLDQNARPRHCDWRPLFGQVDQAQSQLNNQGVGRGDLFLYFGWFRRVEYSRDRLRYVPEAPDIHAFFGWLQVDEVIDVKRSGRESILRKIPWAHEHPHLHPSDKWKKNTIYTSTSKLTLDGQELDLPGAGVFQSMNDSLQLTMPGRSRSLWRLPGWMFPDERPPLSYHKNQTRWTRDGEFVQLKTVGRGQEFVLDLSAYPKAIGWLKNLFETNQPGVTGTESTTARCVSSD